VNGEPVLKNVQIEELNFFKNLTSVLSSSFESRRTPLAWNHRDYICKKKLRQKKSGQGLKKSGQKKSAVGSLHPSNICSSNAQSRVGETCLIRVKQTWEDPPI